VLDHLKIANNNNNNGFIIIFNLKRS